MRKLESAPEGFFFPTFEEISYTVEPLAKHPLYSLKDYAYNPVYNDRQNPRAVLMRYGWGLYEKLTELETYDYYPLMAYHLENIRNKRDWLDSFILLITNNKDRFISECGVEKYTFLYEMVISHYSAFNDAYLSAMTNNCETCREKIAANIKRDVEFLDHLEGHEKEYFLLKMNKDYRKFSTFWNLNLDKSTLDDLRDSRSQIDSYRALEEKVRERAIKKGLTDLTGFRQIRAKCTTTECAKYVAEFLTSTTDNEGGFVFDFNNSSLAEWMPLIFHCTKGKAISAGSYRDKMPSLEEKKRRRNEKGNKG